MNDENCGTCRFWMALSHDAQKHATIGACRRMPPVVIYCPIPVPGVNPQMPNIDWSRQASSFAQTRPQGWCGEWQKAPSKLAIMNS